MIPLLLLMSCFGEEKVGDSSDPNGVDSGGGGADSEPKCSALNSGDDWAWSGACPQMTTPCDIVVEGCSLTIDYSSTDGGMTMGMPYAGTIEGDTITFADGDSVDGCVGLIEDADTVSGTCDGGCEFKLQR